MTYIMDMNEPKQEICISTPAQELDYQTANFLEEFSKVFASIASLSFPMQRETVKQMFCIPEDQLELVAKAEDKEIIGRNGPINLKIFSPKNEEILPVIVYFHRGGWVYGSIKESEVICRRLANETGAIVVAVEYRLSPENKFPIPLEDCYDATQWVVENAATFSGDSNKVILSGESAGGNLAAAVALMTREENQFSVAGQLLIYPILTSDLIKKNYDDSPDKSLLSYQSMQFFWNMYLSSPEDAENPLAAPLKSENFGNVPSCFIVTADYDALKHEGVSYATALEKAGVKVQIKNYYGVIHGFLDLPLANEVKKDAMKDIAAWVQEL